MFGSGSTKLLNTDPDTGGIYCKTVIAKTTYLSSSMKSPTTSGSTRIVTGSYKTKHTQNVTQHCYKQFEFYLPSMIHFKNEVFDKVLTIKKQIFVDFSENFISDSFIFFVKGFGMIFSLHW